MVTISTIRKEKRELYYHQSDRQMLFAGLKLTISETDIRIHERDGFIIWECSLVTLFNRAKLLSLYGRKETRQIERLLQYAQKRTTVISDKSSSLERRHYGL